MAEEKSDEHERPSRRQTIQWIQEIGYVGNAQFGRESDMIDLVAGKLFDVLQDLDHPWKERKAALKILEQISTDSLDDQKVREFVNVVFTGEEVSAPLSRALCAQIQDNRSGIIKQCSITVSALSKAMMLNFGSIAKRIFPTFLIGVGRSNKVIRKHIDGANQQIIENVFLPELMYQLFAAFGSTKNKEVQEHCSSYFLMMLDKWPMATMKKDLDSQKMEQFMSDALRGKFAKTRNDAANAYWLYVQQFPENKKRFKSSFHKPQLRELIKKHKPGSKGKRKAKDDSKVKPGRSRLRMNSKFLRAKKKSRSRRRSASHDFEEEKEVVERVVDEAVKLSSGWEQAAMNEPAVDADDIANIDESRISKRESRILQEAFQRLIKIK